MRGQESARIVWNMCQAPRKASDRFIIMPLEKGHARLIRNYRRT
jgi:hypothetical protein